MKATHQLFQPHLLQSNNGRAFPCVLNFPQPREESTAPLQVGMAGRSMAKQEGVSLPVPWHLSWSGGLPTIIVGEKGEVTPHQNSAQPS
jgi:hypothetical protein